MHGVKRPDLSCPKFFFLLRPTFQKILSFFLARDMELKKLYLISAVLTRERK
jgi:hypothetical protein